MRKPTKKTSHSMLYRILGIAILCVALVTLSYNVTLAWFMDESTTTNKPNIVVIGTIDLEVNTNFNFYNLALAPDTYYTDGIVDGESVSYATTLKTADSNDIKDIYVRAKFTTNREELTLYFNGNLLEVGTTYSSGIANKGNWYYNEFVDENDDGTPESGDGYYYYIGSVTTTEITFNAGYHVDNTLNNDKAGDPVTIDFIFESLQKPYGAYLAEWSSAPQIFKDFAAADSGVSTLD